MLGTLSNAYKSNGSISSNDENKNIITMLVVLDLLLLITALWLLFSRVKPDNQAMPAHLVLLLLSPVVYIAYALVLF